MIRKYFNKLKASEKDNIKWRSHEPSRIEAFSDAVFAFAVSLLIISLEVPHSSKELFEMMRGFVPFIFCFGAIFFIWFCQYRFFRQYGLHDTITIFLNGALLFIVLFYVYPLKFVVSAWMSVGTGKYTIRNEDFIPLILLYNSGFTGIYFLFTLMYYNAFLKREELALTPVEVFQTKTHLYMHLSVTVVGCITIVAAIAGGKLAGYSMACYGFMSFIGILSSKRDKLFRKKFGTVPLSEPHLGEE